MQKNPTALQEEDKQTPPNSLVSDDEISHLVNNDTSNDIQVILGDEKDEVNAVDTEESKTHHKSNDKNATSDLSEIPSAIRECGNNVISDSESSPRHDSQEKGVSRADFDSSRELSDYEKLRLRNIKRNHERLAALGLFTLDIPKLMKNPPNKRKTVTKRKKNVHTFTSPPLRRSTRRRGEVLMESNQKFNSCNEIEEKDEAEFTEEEEKETFEASPITQYVMGIETSPRVSKPNSETNGDWNQLRPTGKLIQDRDIPLYSLDMFSQESTCEWVVGAGKSGVIALWNYATHHHSSNVQQDDGILPLLTWKAHNGRWIADARFLPSNEFKSHPLQLLTAGNDGCVCLWDLSSSSCNTGAPKCLSTTGKQLHSSGIFSMDVASNTAKNELLVCTGSKDKTIALTPFESITRGGDCTPLFRSDFHSGKVGCVEMHKESRSLIASASDDGCVALHDYDSNRVVAELDDAHQRPHSVTWHPKYDDIFMTGECSFYLK